MSEHFRLIQASAHQLPMLADATVHAIITSPPFYGLRKYDGEQGVEWPTVEYAPMAGLAPIHIPAMVCELGLEPTPEAYIGHLILCLREWWRVLRDDGTCWVNLADSFASQGGPEPAQTKWQVDGASATQNGGRSRSPGTLRPKNLMGIPWRFAFAAQADGWYLRSDIIWHKPNAMPESVTDRPTKAHEYIYLLAKAERYYYDADAIRVPHSRKWWDEMVGDEYMTSAEGRNDGGKRKGNGTPTGRNKRTVWGVATRPYSGPKTTRTSRQNPSERGGASGGMKRITSPDCPVHGGSSAPAPKVSDGAYEADGLNHTERNDNHHAQGQLDGCADTGSLRASSSVEQSLDYSHQPCSLPATDHNSQSHKTDHVPVTTPPYTLSGKSPRRIARTSGLPLFSGPRADKQPNNTDGSSSGDNGLSHSPSHTADTPTGQGSFAASSASKMGKCTCKLYPEPTQKANHFACWPPALVEPMVKASTSQHGVCGACGAPWGRVVERESRYTGRQDRDQPEWKGPQVDSSGWEPPVTRAQGWQPTCDCEAGIVPATVLDPFNGSGTTGRAAIKLGRRYIGVDLSAKYLEELTPDRLTVQMELIP